MNQTELQNRIPELQERLRELREVVIPNLIEEEQWLESELTRTESRLYLSLIHISEPTRPY